MTSLLAPSSLLIHPGDPAYDEARLAWNLAVDQRPACVAMPESAEDVVAIVRYAREQNLRVAAQGTGHGSPALGSLEDAVLIKTHKMRRVEIDATHRIARAEAGAQWQDVIVPAAAVGLACLHGSAPDVGVVGYTLGGGLSGYGNRYGTAASRVLGFDVVTADGELIRADRRENRELFRALCGGGGAFGIVTAIEFELFSPGPIQAGHVWFPLERAAEVLKAWAKWAPTLPDTVLTYARMLRIPDMPMAPEPLRGKSFVIVQAVILGDSDALMDPIRKLGPMMDTFSPKTPVDLMDLHMDPPVPVPGAGDTVQLASLPDAAVDAAVDGFAESLLGFQLVYCGDALRDLGGPFVAFTVGMAPTPEMKARVRADVEAQHSAMAPWVTGRNYLNFAESAGDPRRLWDADRYAELVAVKRAIDPDDVIVSNHPVI